MRERFVIANADTNPPWEALCGRAEPGFDLRVAFAKHGELHAFLKENRQIIEEQVEPLLPGESADNAGDEGVRLRIEAQGVLQSFLVRGAGVEPPGIVIDGNPGIVSGVPHLVSMPLRIPRRRAERSRSSPSNPIPVSGRWISTA